MDDDEAVAGTVEFEGVVGGDFGITRDLSAGLSGKDDFEFDRIGQ